jgi:hypothetical protein
MKMHQYGTYQFYGVIEEIVALKWSGLSPDDLVEAAWAYHAFSVQFRENLKIARSLFPTDPLLARLEAEECDTDNLSPWPGIAAPCERMNHDEFMRRIILAAPLPEASRARLEAEAKAYRQAVEGVDTTARAMSIASYEDGGLERVFRAILRAPDWGGPAQRAFYHFLSEHIRFDSDADQGHGALSRHLSLDDRILPLWKAFARLLVGSVPALVRPLVPSHEAAAIRASVLAS